MNYYLLPDRAGHHVIYLFGVCFGKGSLNNKLAFLAVVADVIQGVRCATMRQLWPDKKFQVMFNESSDRQCVKIRGFIQCYAMRAARGVL